MDALVTDHISSIVCNRVSQANATSIMESKFLTPDQKAGTVLQQQIGPIRAVIDQDKFTLPKLDIGVTAGYHLLINNQTIAITAS